MNNFAVAEVEHILGILRRLAGPEATVSFFEYMGIRRLKATISGKAERTRLRGIGHVVGQVAEGARDPPRLDLDQRPARLRASRAVLACSRWLARSRARVGSKSPCGCELPPRRTCTSAGASMPTRTRSPLTRTIVRTIESPT